MEKRESNANAVSCETCREGNVTSVVNYLFRFLLVDFPLKLIMISYGTGMAVVPPNLDVMKNDGKPALVFLRKTNAFKPLGELSSEEKRLGSRIFMEQVQSPQEVRDGSDADLTTPMIFVCTLGYIVFASFTAIYWLQPKSNPTTIARGGEIVSGNDSPLESVALKGATTLGKATLISSSGARPMVREFRLRGEVLMCDVMRYRGCCVVQSRISITALLGSQGLPLFLFLGGSNNCIAFGLLCESQRVCECFPSLGGTGQVM